MLLDEPSLGLAPLIVGALGDIIKKINEAQVSIILVEQNAKMALKLSSRAYVIETGRIVMEGRSEDIANDRNIVKAYLGGD